MGRVNGLAFLYAGQGSQRVGMGAAVRDYDRHLFDRWFGLVEAEAELPLRHYALTGSAETLVRTDVAQPVLFAHEMALTELAHRGGLRPSMVAGHSLGEYVAAVACGSLSAQDGARLVVKRGRLMSEVSGGTMGAVVGLQELDVRGLCAEVGDGRVVVANRNAPSQTVVSGDEIAVAAVLDRSRAAGAIRVVRLPVAAAFHSPAMDDVQAQVAEYARAVTWRDPVVRFAVNASGQLARTGAEVRDALIAQITAEVRWTACVQTLLTAGARSFVELAPRPVLAPLVRQIKPGARVTSVASPDQLDGVSVS